MDTSVGLGSLTVWEAAKGALLCEDFQKMPDPLFKVPKFPYSPLCINVNTKIIKLSLDLLLKYGAVVLSSRNSAAVLLRMSCAIHVHVQL